MRELNKKFGNRIGNALFRMGVTTVDELKEYAEKYPFEDYVDKATRWRKIGVTSYSLIEQYLYSLKKENDIYG